MQEITKITLFNGWFFKRRTLNGSVSWTVQIDRGPYLINFTYMADDPLLLPTVRHFYLKIMSLDPLPLYFSINENLTDGSRWCIVDKYWISTLQLLLHGHFIFQNLAHFHEKISKPYVLFVCWCGKKIHMKIKVLVPCGTKCQSINHWNQYLLVCFRE